MPRHNGTAFHFHEVITNATPRCQPRPIAHDLYRTSRSNPMNCPQQNQAQTWMKIAHCRPAKPPATNKLPSCATIECWYLASLRGALVDHSPVLRSSISTSLITLHRAPFDNRNNVSINQRQQLLYRLRAATGSLLALVVVASCNIQEPAI